MRYQLDEAIYKIIGDIAKQVKQYPAFQDPGIDVEDIRGDLALLMMEEIPKFNPAVGRWEAFVLTHLKTKTIDLVRKHCREKAAFFRDNFISLDALLEYGQSGALDGNVEACLARSDAADVSSMEFREAVAGLSAELAAVLARLEFRGQRQLAREMGLPYNTFRYRYIQPLAEHFDRAGFRLSDWRKEKKNGKGK